MPLGERQTEDYQPVIRMGEQGSCRAWHGFGRSLSLPVKTTLPLALAMGVGNVAKDSLVVCQTRKLGFRTSRGA